MKLCIDCKYRTTQFLDLCGHPKNLSPVNGKPYQSCAFARSASAFSFCGSAAALFEPKEVTTPPPIAEPKHTPPSTFTTWARKMWHLWK